MAVIQLLKLKMPGMLTDGVRSVVQGLVDEVLADVRERYSFLCAALGEREEDWFPACFWKVDGADCGSLARVIVLVARLG